MKKELALTVAIMIAAAPVAFADETGLAGMHEWKQEKGRRVCMTDHFHDGAGKGKTQKEARAAAERAWIDFTAFEYGSVWGSFKLAVSKTMDCKETGAVWSCFTSARPCKRYLKPRSGYAKSAGR
jgi:hypothetical protein